MQFSNQLKNKLRGDKNSNPIPNLKNLGFQRVSNYANRQNDKITRRGLSYHFA